jgi:hypothetical protein
MNDPRLWNLRLGISPELAIAKRCLWRVAPLFSNCQR